METLEDTDIKKTRKPQRCFGCLEMIPVGSPAHMQTIADGGCVYRMYTHMVCEQIMGYIDLYDDEYAGLHQGSTRNRPERSTLT